ncbi:DUF4232 domain-containing protein [Streptomyces sp. PTD5-9]|uniref:DUF4232 domain-containing protein n=1 Tax=Streptomyces sp. PTD5-9 TaxID=3120150 RepID=UPI00300BAEFE
MRTNLIRTTALAATALVAALSLTACNGDDLADNTTPTGSSSPETQATGTAGGDQATGNGDDGKPGADAENVASASAGSSHSGSSGSGSNGSATGGRSNTGGGTGKTGGGSPVTCTGDNTRVTISKVSRPINHLLLTATNTGSRTCYAYHAPGLRFDDSQAAFPVLRDSIPQAVVALEPGQSAYAAIGLSGEDDVKDLHKGSRLGVYFTSKSNSGSTGSPADLKLPADTYWGDNGFVTYWQSEMDLALTY